MNGRPAPAPPASISAAAELVASRALSPVDLTETCLRVIEAREPDVSAFAAVDGERALREARLLEDELLRTGPRSPLHGVPVAVKDLLDVEGLPTRAGSPVLGDAPAAASDAAAVAALRAAGAVIIGKTHTHEFALGAVTPQTRHPTHPDRIAGGSSGGSAAAVAAGEVLGALGTDTGGSVRVPAALCGVVGLKPRAGAVSMRGVVPLSPLLDSCGVLAADVRDADLLWRALSPTTPPTTPGTLRVGVATDDTLGAVSDEVAEAAAKAASVLGTRSDIELTPVSPPPFDDWAPARIIPLLADMLETHAGRDWYPRRAALYGPDTRAALDTATSFTTADLIKALRTTARLVERFMDCLIACDVLLLPTVERTAPERRELSRPEHPYNPSALLRLCAPVNWCPLAAISVPCGTSATGLPIGVQFVGRDEATVIECASRYESE